MARKTDYFRHISQYAFYCHFPQFAIMVLTRHLVSARAEGPSMAMIGKRSVDACTALKGKRR